MRRYRSCLYCLALLSLGLPSTGQAQTIDPAHHGEQRQKLHELDRKQAIERRFWSAHPRSQPQWGNAVPGAQLMVLHRQRAAALAARSKQHIAASPLANPLSNPSTVSLPGVQMRVPFAGGEFPTSIVTGDFNKDGHLDYAVANGATNDIWVFLGKGDGTFQLPRVVPLSKGLTPIYLVAADLRGIGTLDLVVAEYDSATVGVLLGNGDGTFGYESIYNLPEPPGALTINDFNHDGKLDVAAVMVTEFDPGTLGVPYIASLKGNGDGTFANPVITSNWGFYSAVTDVDSADVNGDGLPDLLITSPNGLDNSTIYLNNGDGTFKEGQLVVATGDFNDPIAGRLADLNGDGCPDAAVADLVGAVWVSLGDCKGDFGAIQTNYMGDANAAVHIADVNGDGHLDLITSSEISEEPNYEYTSGNTMNVAFGDGKGNFSPVRVYPGPSEALSLAVGDFEGNGKPDVVTADIDTDTTTIFRNDGAGGFGFPQGIDAGIAASGVQVVATGQPMFADVNGDGKPDLVLIGGSTDYVTTTYLNDGTGRLEPGVNSDSGVAGSTSGFAFATVSDYRLGDFRNTGHLDMLAIDGWNFGIIFQPGNGDGTFGKGTYTTNAAAYGAMAVADFNGDGKLDFVAINGGPPHDLNVFLGNGDGMFRAGQSVSFSDNAESVVRAWAGDFNHDGKADVLVFTTGNGYWTTASTVWEFDGNGDGTFQPGRRSLTDFEPFVLADVNGDGRPDIERYDFMWPDGTTTTEGPARFTTYLGQLDGSFMKSSSYSPYAGTPEDVRPFLQYGDPADSSLVGDFNGDGKPEEVAWQYEIGFEVYAQFLMGNGDGTFTPTYDIFPFAEYNYPMWTSSLDGSRTSDLLMVDNGSFGTTVFKGGPAPTLQMGLDQEIVNGTSGCGTVFPDIVSASDRIVTFSSSVPGVDVPASIDLPAGAASANFCFTLASNYDWHRVFDINAQLDSGTATVYSSQSYLLGFTAAVSTTTIGPIYGGQRTAPFTFTLTGQPGYSSVAKLSCAGLPVGYSCTFGSNMLDVTPGAPVSTSVIVNTTSMSWGSPINVTIVADDGNIAQRQTVAITVAYLSISGSYPGSIMTTASPGSNSMNMFVTGIPPYSFSCSGLPAGSTCSFSGTQVNFPAPSNIELTVTTPSGLSAVNTPFQVNVSSGGQDASASETLGVFSFTVLPPTAATDWAFAGSSPKVTFPIQVTNLASAEITLSCTVNFPTPAQCSNTNWFISSGANSESPTLIVPSGVPVGQYQMALTASVDGATQTSTFPFYVASMSGSLSASSLTLNNLGTGNLNVTLNATAGFNAKVVLNCSYVAALPCSFNPSSVQLVGGTPQTSAVTITSINAASNHRPAGVLPARTGLVLASLLPLGLLLRMRGRRFQSLFLSAFVAVLLTFVASCGSGGNRSGGGGGGGGSQSQTYVLTVTATSVDTALNQTLGTVTVTVGQ